nr:C39 family peptidase [Lachnospiraceae bacterium]
MKRRKGRKRMRILSFLLVWVIVFSNLQTIDIRNVNAATPGSKRGIELKNILQIGEKWSKVKVGTGTIGGSGCGIISTVSAVYNLNGRMMDPVEITKDCYQKGYWNAADGVLCADFFYYIGKKYGEKYEFKIGKKINAKVSDRRLIEHLEAGGTAIIHVTKHFMSIVDYDSNTKKYLVFDGAPSEIGGNSRRAGLTSKKGDWKTAAQLSAGNGISVDAFYLVSNYSSSYKIGINEIKITNTSATINSTLNKYAKVKSWGYDLGLSESNRDEVKGCGSAKDSQKEFKTTISKYKGKDLQPNKTYYYKIWIKTDNGTPSYEG